MDSCGWTDASLTYTGLLKGNGGGGFAQGVDCSHNDLVGRGGEDLRKMDTTAVLMVRVFLHLQRVLVMSAGMKQEVAVSSGVAETHYGPRQLTRSGSVHS